MVMRSIRSSMHPVHRSKFEDEPEVVRDSYKGKQFLPSCAKSGRTPDTYFGLDNAKKHLYVAEVTQGSLNWRVVYCTQRMWDTCAASLTILIGLQFSIYTERAFLQLSVIPAICSAGPPLR